MGWTGGYRSNLKRKRIDCCSLGSHSCRTTGGRRLLGSTVRSMGSLCAICVELVDRVKWKNTPTLRSTLKK